MAENIIKLDDVQKDAAKDEFHAIRGHAIDTYAGLEQSLCSLLATLTGMPRDVAAVIFFKIGSTRAREDILTRLLKKKCGDSYSVFWNSAQKLIYQVSQKRNEIVHWHAAINMDDKGFVNNALYPPNFWDSIKSTPPIVSTDLVDFIHKCSFFTRLFNMFDSYIDGRLQKSLNEDQLKPWNDVFQQLAVYPPQDTHPFSQKQ